MMNSSKMFVRIQHTLSTLLIWLIGLTMSVKESKSAKKRSKVSMSIIKFWLIKRNDLAITLNLKKNFVLKQ